MENLIRIYYEWEIQLQVLLSFAIQIFLFFTGVLRLRGSNTFLRLLIWLAYLGADIVAIYAIGYLSRHESALNGCGTLTDNHPLAFFWAPFLLVHLGGQDTITAFSMEDNNLWTRHLLNMVVQVAIAIYVFWKSIGRYSMQLLLSGIFVLAAGFIKYGERTWCMKQGSYKNIETSSGSRYKAQLPQDDGEDNVCAVLHSMRHVFNAFAGRGVAYEASSAHDLIKKLDIQLRMMYDDIYTKALVMRTKVGIILRCTSQICMVVSFMLFVIGDSQSYNKVDIAVTYSLYIGGLFLEFCATFILMKSPWSWAWLKARRYDMLARFSSFLYSSGLNGWPNKRPLWSNVIGQYNLHHWSTGTQARSFSHLLMTMVRKLAKLVGVQKEKIFWMSKLLDTEYVKADKTLKCLVEGVCRFIAEVEGLEGLSKLKVPQEFAEMLRLCGSIGISVNICILHAITESIRCKCETAVAFDSEAASLLEDCVQLSRYMMYLLVNHPYLLPLNHSVDVALEAAEQSGVFNLPDTVFPSLASIREMWIRIIIYAASNSRAEMHAAMLARGGEPLTFTWLLLRLRTSGLLKVDLIRPSELGSFLHVWSVIALDFEEGGDGGLGDVQYRLST